MVDVGLTPLNDVCVWARVLAQMRGHSSLVVECQDAPLIKETIRDKHMLPYT